MIFSTVGEKYYLMFGGKLGTFYPIAGINLQYSSYAINFADAVFRSKYLRIVNTSLLSCTPILTITFLISFPTIPSDVLLGLYSVSQPHLGKSYPTS